MSISRQLVATMFSLGFCVATVARGQSCAGVIRQTTSRPPSYTVSARSLRFPQKAWKHFEKARAASENNQPDIMEQEIAQVLAAAPRFAEVYLLRASHESQDGRPEAALEITAAARQIEPQLPWSAVVMASAFNQLHRYREAVGELERAHGEEADSWQARYERARAETGLHNTEPALHWSELAVAAAPVGCTDARIVRANALQSAGRQTEAIQELKTYLALDRRGHHRAQVLAVIDKAEGSRPEQNSDLMAMR